jgi:hypothetical protein
MSTPLRFLMGLGLVGVTACATVGSGSAAGFAPSAASARSPISARGAVPCASCNSVIPMPPELTRAIETRLSDLEKRGGVCSQYAEVLERSYREGRITLREYMWREEGRLVSGEARPNGEMILAREIDPLNVGVRTVDDVLWSVEHEAVHIAFRISSGVGLQEDRANRYVQACRTDASTG